MKSFNIVVCASGGGGNFRSLIKYQCDYGYHISLLIVDRECPTIKIAKENGISYSVLEKKVLGKSFFEEFEKIVPIDTNLIVLAGFLPIIPKWICEKWERKIINIHPSLLPKYGGKGMYGVKVQEAILRNHEKYAGCTVHYVDSEIDTGEIIAQKKILVMENESAWELGGRVFNEEIILLPLAIKHIREAMKVIP
ncbi:formyltransferase family protein [Bacteroides thetaiotaomicron]|uniref:formyltransferase family protein n=1 Tax=Bacteroides thetaiotaomicron TaxID=818 RepID=UPI00232C533F|nr:formyltransferase family protein [Bacteroides thetaiotaomicron]MDC2203025.1 formyltransferase family protein [Bacteroides thetaiotaomicron]MDC2207880.1 formyltransferase family protein [Bacteroides thetaiotaomicron]